MGPFVVRLGRIGRGLGRADAARPWVMDVVVVVLLFAAFCLPDLVGRGGLDEDAPPALRAAFADLSPAGVVAFQAGLVLPLLWRRRAPVIAFGSVLAVFTVQWAAWVPLRADVALFVAAYSLALYGRPRALPWACSALAAALLLVAGRMSVVVSFWVALFFLLCAATAALAVGLAVRIRRAQLAGLRERAARLEVERDQRGRLAVATERARVAREMHDIVGHNLSVMITLADAGAYATDVTPHRGKEALLLIGDTGRQALDELRRVLGLLRDTGEGGPRPPELHPQPGLADVDALCAGVRAAGLEVVYRTGGGLDALDGGVQLTVHRIVQEALTNTLKHAGAGARVRLTIVLEGTRLDVRVRDTGPAPRPAAPTGQERRQGREGQQAREGRRGREAHEGQGLVGMRERVALYGGSLAAGPAPGGGWSVEATLDLTPRGGAG
ncbi:MULTISPECIES: sensor histidine kinase [unclassified Streptomyces]|uniref:sensor histidine kinase n=1 Tax=unclassified Streptomyces TaxID=2593676 RepID=UPI00381C9BC6